MKSASGVAQVPRAQQGIAAKGFPRCSVIVAVDSLAVFAMYASAGSVSIVGMQAAVGGRSCVSLDLARWLRRTFEVAKSSRERRSTESTIVQLVGRWLFPFS